MNRPEQPAHAACRSPTCSRGPTSATSRSTRSASAACAIRSRSPTATASPQSTIADLRTCYVALPEDRKGTHMSRLVELLEERAAPGARAADGREPARCCSTTSSRGSTRRAGRIELAFPFFVRKTAPVSGVASLLDYEVRLAGELRDGRITQTIAVAVPVTSLCPCSKEIAEYGAHNQRSTVTITRAHARAGARRRAAAHRRGRGVERALRHPQARRREVRDRARLRQSALRRGPGARRRRRGSPPIRAFDGFVVEAENFESIHNHSAYARIARGHVGSTATLCGEAQPARCRARLTPHPSQPSRSRGRPVAPPSVASLPRSRRIRA